MYPKSTRPSAKFVYEILDYSLQISTKNREFIVKNQLISYLQKIQFSSIIKKTKFWRKNSWRKKYADDI